MSCPRGLDGKTAVVTGAAGAIGRAVVARLVAAGVRVLAVDIDAGAVEAAVADFGAAAAWYAADVSHVDDTDRYLAEAVRRFGPLELLHANAGIQGPVVPVWDLDPDDFDRTYAVNARGCLLAIRGAARVMRAHGTPGAIVATSSTGGLRGERGSAAYRATKHAVIGIVRCAAHDLAPHGVRVNVICPGFVDTALMERAHATIAASTGVPVDDVAERLARRIPLGRYARPDEVAATVAWLLSGESSYLTGEVVTVSGGLMA